MSRIKRTRPSPAILIAVLALVAALAGSAIAGEGTTSGKKGLDKKEKKQTKKIAKKQADKQIDEKAPGLSVANAESAQSAVSANPVAYARVAANGAVSSAKGVTNANVTKGGTGAYCLRGLNLNLRGGQVTPDGAGPKFSVSGSFEIGDSFGACSGVPNLQAVVTMSDSGPSFDDLPFYLTLYE